MEDWNFNRFGVIRFSKLLNFISGTYRRTLQILYWIGLVPIRWQIMIGCLKGSKSLIFFLQLFPMISQRYIEKSHYILHWTQWLTTLQFKYQAYNNNNFFYYKKTGEKNCKRGLPFGPLLTVNYNLSRRK